MITLRSKTPVRFEFSDGVSETTVTLALDDDTDALRAKLQRVLDLEAGGGLPLRQPGAALQAARESFEPLYDSAEAERRLTAQGPMGWNDVDLDKLPEA